MSSYLCVTLRFLQPHFHGRADAGEGEWPPSPLRVFQALVAAAARCSQFESFEDVSAALQWLEERSAPSILASTGKPAESPYRLYVPDNVGDKVAGSWVRGGDASIASYRTEKDVRSTHIDELTPVHYLFALDEGPCPYLDKLAIAANSITHVGWGVDMAMGDAVVVSGDEAAKLPGERWEPVDRVGATALRVPTMGTLDALATRHGAFLNRLGHDERGNVSFSPVPPLTRFRVVEYARSTDVAVRPTAVFELRDDDESFFRYPQRQLIHIAGMVRHLAIELVKMSPPSGVNSDWIRTYVAGHADADAAEHRQFSYLPLPSIGHLHTDPSVRRVMIAAPAGDDRFLNHLARLLAGQRLRPTKETRMAHPPTLARVRRDKVAAKYARRAIQWASVTPVILPGHDDHKPNKTRRLIMKALLQSGIDQPCEFEWGPFSHFRKALSAHKYDREKKPTGYIRPSYLLSKTAVHVKLRFRDELKVPGPVAIGAGRHCGLGLLAAIGD